MCAPEIPAHFAAVRVASAHGFAAHAIVAEGRVVFVAAALCELTSALGTEASRPVHARCVPRGALTHRIKRAHEVAAIRVVAAGIRVHCEARSAELGTATFARFLGQHHALRIPSDVAAGGIDSAHAVTASGFGTRWTRVRFETRLAAGAAGVAKLVRQRHAHIIPRDIAAGRFDHAHGGAAFRIVAPRSNQVCGEAIVGRGGTVRLRVDIAYAMQREKKRADRDTRRGLKLSKDSMHHGEQVKRR